jgi:hypothetical protein
MKLTVRIASSDVAICHVTESEKQTAVTLPLRVSVGAVHGKQERSVLRRSSIRSIQMQADFRKHITLF